MPGTAIESRCMPSICVVSENASKRSTQSRSSSFNWLFQLCLTRVVNSGSFVVFSLALTQFAEASQQFSGTIPQPLLEFTCVFITNYPSEDRSVEGTFRMSGNSAEDTKAQRRLEYPKTSILPFRQSELTCMLTDINYYAFYPWPIIFLLLVWEGLRGCDLTPCQMKLSSPGSNGNSSPNVGVRNAPDANTFLKLCDY